MKYFLVLAVLTAGSALLPAQSGDSPQIAYRILMNYIQEQERHAGDSKAAAGVLYGLGAVVGAGALGLWYLGDDLSKSSAGTALDPDVKLWTTVGLGAGGAVLLGTGFLVRNAKPTDYRLRFSDVLQATDAETQNLLAAASLWALADEAKGKRLTSAWTGILTPLVTTAAMIALNLGTNKPWTDNLVAVNSSQVFGIIGGVAQLYKPSDEEYLYLKYQAALGNTVP